MINVATLLFSGICLIGFVFYKFQVFELNSWEAGVKKVLTFLVDWIYEESTGKTRVLNYVNNALILSNQEALDLTASFKNHPFDTPSIVSFIPIANGIQWFDIASCGLHPRYANIPREQLEKLASHIIENFFMESRGTQVPIFMKVVTPTRLYFAIPISEQGRKFLEAQEATKVATPLPDLPYDIPEEEIPAFDQSDDFEL